MVRNMVAHVHIPVVHQGPSIGLHHLMNSIDDRQAYGNHLSNCEALKGLG